jgi:hypothetical protein
MLVLLRHMSAQLADPTLPAAAFMVATAEDDPPSGRDRFVTFCWVISIVICLSASLLGIMSKQWIRAYQEDIAGEPRHALERRQTRYETLQSMQMLKLMSSLPFVVETGVIFFLVGFFAFLQGINSASTILNAIIALLIIVGLLVIAIFALPFVFQITPTLQRRRRQRTSSFQSSFYSPWTHIVRLFRRFFPLIETVEVLGPSHNLGASRDIARALKWIRTHVVKISPRATNHFFRAVQEAGCGYQLADETDTLCYRHMNSLPSFVWKGAELAALDQSTAFESLIRSIKLRACSSCDVKCDYTIIYEKLHTSINKPGLLPGKIVVFIYIFSHIILLTLIRRPSFAILFGNQARLFLWPYKWSIRAVFICTMHSCSPSAPFD